MATQSTIPATPSGLHRCHAVSKEELKEMVKSYRNGLDKNETKSIVLDVDAIRAMINHYSDSNKLGGADPIRGIRIYFFRESLKREYSSGDKIGQVGDKGQISAVLIPVNNWREYLGEEGKKLGYYLHVDDMFDIDDKCLMLTPGGENTGLCPVNCNGSI